MRLAERPGSSATCEGIAPRALHPNARRQSQHRVRTAARSSRPVSNLRGGLSDPLCRSVAIRCDR
jgi:hypothetical protein